LDRNTKLAGAFLFVFALPFAVGGMSALVSTIAHMVAGTAKPNEWVLLIIGLVFTAIGLGLMYAVIYGSKVLKRQQRAQAEHPAEPWLWREEWAQGRIASKTRSTMIGAWIFAVIWNAVSIPVLLMLPKATAQGPIGYLVLIFPLSGVLLLVRAVRQTLAYREFGKTCFEMASVPGVIGGELRGQVQARFPHSADHGVHLQLTCVNRVTTGSGDSRSTRENILWRAESDLTSAQLYPGPSGTTIPVNFRIPGDLQPSEKSGPGDGIVWLLEALADVPGIDYHDIFEVPVFRTQQTSLQPEPEPRIPIEAPLAVRPAALTVQMTQTDKGVEFYFPMARNKGFGAATTAFLLIFSTATYFLAGSSAPFIFPAAFGFFALILFYISMQMWFGTTGVGIGNGTMLVQDGWFGGGKVRQFAFAELASIASKITSQQGDATGTPYYDIELSLQSGRKVTLGRTIRNKKEVDWLIEEMKRLTGLQPKSMTAGAP